MHRALSEMVDSPKLVFIGMHLVWSSLLEPPADQCEDPELVLGTSERIRTAIYDLYFAPIHNYNTTPSACYQDFDECYKLAALIDPHVRASQWTVAAPLPPDGSAGEHTSIPPLFLAVQDEATVAVEGVLVSASVYAFDGPGCATIDASGAASTLPTLVSGTSNVTDAVGVTSLQLLLDTHGCSEGNLILRLSTPSTPDVDGTGLSRFARVQLYKKNLNAQFETEATSVSTTSVDNYTDVTVESTLYINATVSIAYRYRPLMASSHASAPASHASPPTTHAHHHACTPPRMHTTAHPCTLCHDGARMTHAHLVSRGTYAVRE